MSNKTRKHIWPMPLVMSIAIIGVLAAFLVLASNPGETQAHGEFVEGTPHCPSLSDEIAHDIGGSAFDHTCTEGPATNTAPAVGAAIPGQSISTGGTGTVQSTITDADADDTLAWSVASSDDTVATANVDNMGMVTVTAVAPGTATITVTATDPDDESASQTFMVTVTDPGPPSATGAMFTSSSTSASATVELKLTTTLTGDVSPGGAFVLYLEDDYQAPDAISARDVYFVVTPADPNDDESADRTGNGARVYATQNPEVDTDDHFTADKDDIDIRVSVPDLCTSDTQVCQGQNGPKSGDTVTMVIQKSAGIRNPSEAGTHSVGLSVVGSAESIGAPMYSTYRAYEKDSDLATSAQKSNLEVVLGMHDSLDDDVEASDIGFKTLAKIGISDPDNDRGYEMTVTGSGFNNGTSAAVYVLADRNATETPACRTIIEKGTEVGAALVDTDDKVSVTFEVTAPTFQSGNVNYICMVDGEGRMSDTDVEDFNLQPSIKVVPNSVASGDTVNVFARDFPYTSAGDNGFKRIRIANQVISVTSSSSIRPDGSGEATFKVPGGLEGILRIDAMWGAKEDDKKITITGGQLSVSKTEALPNETLTITGNGFGRQTCIPASSITLDNVPVIVDEESTTVSCDPDRNDATNNSVPGVGVSNSGQFVATIILWQAEGTDNPTLIPGVHELSVTDNTGFGSDVDITIPEPTVKVGPDVAGPRDYITIIGENWPVDNPENPESVAVTIEVADTTRARTYTLFADAAGRVTQEHRVHRNVAIPSTVQVKMSYGVVAEIGSFSVPASTIEVTPGEAQPGDTITLTAGNMPVYSEVDYIEIGGTRSNDPGVNTDRDGNVTVEDVLIPGLDPGLYSVVINVKGTIAIGEINVLAESSAAGAPSELPGAVENLGDSLVAIFHFDDVGKTWSFHDPRPEFAELNTLTEMVNGEAYWILVNESVDEAILNNKVRSLTCRGDDCWNLEVW